MESLHDAELRKEVFVSVCVVYVIASANEPLRPYAWRHSQVSHETQIDETFRLLFMVLLWNFSATIHTHRRTQRRRWSFLKDMYIKSNATAYTMDFA